MRAIAPGPENSTVTLSEKGWLPCKIVLGHVWLASVVITVRFERRQTIGTTLILESLIRVGWQKRTGEALHAEAHKPMAHNTP